MLHARKAHLDDMATLCELYEAIVADMEDRGLDQWRWGIYPNEDTLGQDIQEESMYVLLREDELIGAFCLNREQEPQYAALYWHYGVRPCVVHRLAIAPAHQGQHIGKEAMELIYGLARAMECDCVRLDTYTLNDRAMRLYEGLGMRRVGQVHFEERDAPFQCFEIPLTEDCSLLPIRMHPAFRHGKDTPWGGDGLREYLGKEIPDDRTGESLEISVIPGLCSKNDNGEGLDVLLARYGRKIQGEGVPGPFPLLLKFIHAREPLSVQVHPGDDYAHTHEDGKLGKTEAWLILHAEPGAQLVYGVLPGTTKEALREASLEGKAVEGLLRRVPVKAGDVCMIPAGCVHAIGAGIVLYEIQQSSDVTYRFYDWDRADEKGNRRELHLDKAIAVTDLHCQLSPIHKTDAPGVQTLLNNGVFTLKRLNVEGEMELSPDRRRFRFLTALHNLLLTWEGDALSLEKGDSVLLPAFCPPVTIQGAGEAILAEPGIEQMME